MSKPCAICRFWREMEVEGNAARWGRCQNMDSLFRETLAGMSCCNRHTPKGRLGPTP